MNKKMNNKGFSLVELIVVIAIMGILAVTLAPRLTQYVEKARYASDMDVANTIFNAAKLAKVENTVSNSLTVKLGATSTEATPSVYEVSADGKKWTLEAAYTAGTASDQDFFDDFIAILDNFELKSNNTANPTGTPVAVVSNYTLSTDVDGKMSILLDYAGDGFTSGTDYKISE